MPRTKRVELGWEHPETEEAYRLICNVTPGTPDRGPDFGCAGGYPGDPPEVEVLEVIEDRPGGMKRPELVEVVTRTFDRLMECALDELSYAAEDGLVDTIEEARGER